MNTLHSKPRVLIVSSRPDWHGQRLLNALTKAGADARVTSLDACGFAIGKGPSGLSIPECQDRLPDAVVVRTVGGGTFEQVTMRLSVLHALHDLGVVVYNPPRAIERCVDKSMTSFILSHAGLPTPPTWTTESPVIAADIVAEEAAMGNRVVLKPLFGAQGIGLKLMDSPDQLPAPDSIGGAFYLQRYIPAPENKWRDWRVLVVGGKAEAAMMRVGTSWITNVRQGASCVAAPAAGDLAQLSIEAAKAVGALYAGIDLVLDQDGRFTILEVNSMPAWRGLQSVTEFDVATLLASDIMKLLPLHSPRRAGASAPLAAGARCLPVKSSGSNDENT